MTQAVFTVGARHHDGSTSIWHVPAEGEAKSHADAGAWVGYEIVKEEPYHRAGVVLTCITGGKA